MGKGKLFIGLIHYPVTNKYGEIISTSITNLDVHDLGRLSATFNLPAFFVVNPSKSQLAMCQRLKNYWLGGPGAGFNESRRQAFEKLILLEKTEDITTSLQAQFGITKAKFMVTTARKLEGAISCLKVGEKLTEGENMVLLFGTGYGLTQEALSQADYILEPISGAADYNHLSVRCAMAILLDRIFRF